MDDWRLAEDMSLLGEAIEGACRPEVSVRSAHQILGAGAYDDLRTSIGRRIDRLAATGW